MLSAAYVSAVPTNVSQCQIIGASGDYALNQSISSASSCLNMTVSNIDLDCRGYTITYNTGGSTTRFGINAQNGTNALTNVSVKNCILNKGSNLQTAGYAIQLSRFSDSQIINNTAYTNGTTNNYGILLTTNCQNNLIENNTIYTNGTSTGNAGIVLLVGSSHNIIRYNNINTSGTTTGFGIYISGVTTPSINNTVVNNVIYASGSTTDNYGIYLYRNANSNNITKNTVFTRGTTTNHGIYAIGTTGITANNNIIESNLINASGTAATSTNYGIILSSNANYNNVSNNTIYTNGSTSNYGILILGTAALASNNNIARRNTIRTNGSTTANSGIAIFTNANNNEVYHNNIIIDGNRTGNGINLNGDTFAVNNNLLYSNNISTDGRFDANYGIYLYRNANFNNISNNNIRTSGTTGNHGIYCDATTSESANGTIIHQNNINVSGRAAARSNYGIILATFANFNNLTNNNITTEGTTANFGIYVVGAAALTSNSNIIHRNNITALGTTNNNWGIYVYQNANSNNISNNEIRTNGTTTNYGIYILGTATNTANNNIIEYNNVRTVGSTTDNYGILLSTNANSNSVYSNNISTNGSSANHGIYINGDTFASNLNKVYLNSIYTSGSAANNYGIYLRRNSNNNNISYNTIYANGTTGNHGIYAVGTTSESVNNNIFDYNNVNVTGYAAAITSYAFWLSSNANNNNATGNNFSTSGTTANYGVHILGTATLTSNNNIIAGNVIRISGSTTNNYGIYLLTNANQNNISSNDIITSGTTGNVGIIASGTTFRSASNIISENIIRTFGTSTNYGIYVTANANQNNITDNSIKTNGTVANHGLFFHGLASTPVENNTALSNSIETICSSGSSNCCGIRLENLSGNNSFIRNDIITGSNSYNHGIYLFGISTLNVNGNIFESNIINVSNAERIMVFSWSLNNIFKNNSIINRGGSYNDINISSSVNGSILMDQYLEPYSFLGVGGIVHVNNSAYGAISFLSPINGSGSNFSRNVQLSYNYSFVNSSFSGLNKSARITFYSLPFTNPVIKKDNETCVDCNIISYANNTLVFNVTGFSSYSSSENPVVPPIIESININDSLIPEGEIILSAGYTREVICYVTVSDSLGVGNIVGANATFYYYLNLSNHRDDNLTHYTNRSCSLNQTNPTNKVFACGFDVWYYANNGTWHCNATAYNAQSGTNSSNITTMINPLYAINLTDGLSFGTVEAGYSSDEVLANITSLGNMPINITLQGYAITPGDGVGMNCSDGSNISISNIGFSKTSSTYIQKTALDGSMQDFNITLLRQINNTLIINSTYWQIVPDPAIGVYGRYCEGYVIFQAEAP